MLTELAIGTISEWYAQQRADLMKQLQKEMSEPIDALLSETLVDLGFVVQRRPPPEQQSDWNTWLFHLACHIYRFRVWLDSMARRLIQMSRFKTPDNEDILAEAFLRATAAIRKDRLPENESNFCAWLYAIIWRTGCDYWNNRRRRKSEALLDDPPDPRPIGSLCDEEDLLALADVIDKLPDPIDREIARAKAQGETQSSIAARLQKSEPWISRRWNVVMGELRTRMLQEAT